MPDVMPTKVAARNALCLFGLLMLALGNSACGESTVTAAPADQPSLASDDVRIQSAVAQLDALAAEMMSRSGIPGMAVAVVRGEDVIYAKGFGVRRVGEPDLVDADTVFALASVSKLIGATVVARQVTLGEVSWQTPMRQLFSWFKLADPKDSAEVTVGDLYAHRSGLPDHAGDTFRRVELRHGHDPATAVAATRYIPGAEVRLH